MANGNPGRPDPDLIRRLAALLPAESQALFANILGGSPDTMLARIAQATGRRPEELAGLAHDPEALTRLANDTLAQAGKNANQIRELFRQANLIP